MDKAKIIANAKSEFLRHPWETFVDEPPSVAAGGKGVVVAGCPQCKKRLNTTSQYLEHLFDDVLTQILERALTDAETH
jgi:hypothetical protein